MKYLLSITLLFFSLTEYGLAQNDVFEQEVLKCIQSNGTYEYYENFVDKTFESYLANRSGNTIPDEVLNDLKQESMDELSHYLISIYRKHFVLQDVKNMYALYTSKAGRKMLFKPEGLNAKERSELSQFYTSKTGQKIKASQNDMNAAMKQILQIWARDFDTEIRNDLAQRGFEF